MGNFTAAVTKPPLPNVVETDRKISEHLATAAARSHFITDGGEGWRDDFDKQNYRVGHSFPSGWTDYFTRHSVVWIGG